MRTFGMEKGAVATQRDLTSFTHVLRISVPLMLSALSGASMQFVDRLILSHYSLDSMNAAAGAGLPVFVFTLGAVGVAMIAEVFVGQHYGAKRYEQMGPAVWQMLWFSLMTICVFWSVGTAGAGLCVPTAYWAEGIPYFRCLMWFGFLFPMQAALSGFFVGQNKVKLVTIVVVLGNVLNCILDYVMVLGITDYLAPMGTLGAAIATVLSQFAVVCVLFYYFFSKQYRQTAGTGKWQFNKKIYWECLQIGIPGALGHMIEMLAWLVLVHLLTAVGVLHITVYNIGLNFFILFVFSYEGLNKGVTVLSANLIGANKVDKLRKLLFSALKVHGLLALIFAVPFLVYPEYLASFFLNNLNESKGALNVAKSEVLRHSVSVLCAVWVYLLIDGIVWVMAGLLTGGKDTKFVMLVNAVNAWFFSLLPIYIVVVKYNGAPSLVWWLASAYALMNLLCFWWRFESGNWLARSSLQTAV